MNDSKTEANNKITPDSHFHEGEQEIQSRYGVREKMERFSKQVIASSMPEQHREFYQQLPFVLLGHADTDNWPWASMLFDDDGFITSANDKTLSIHFKHVDGDPFSEHIKQHDRGDKSKHTRIGLLGIELSTRRRNRMAGHITHVEDNSIDIEVDQAFGNCPQYIQTRELTRIETSEQEESEAIKLTEFDKGTVEFIQNSDTFFVASFVQPDNDNANINEGVDVSHRGGRPGFIRVDGNDTLTIPDYTGNFHFNTLGNFLLTPKAGLLFPDFKTGHLLSLTGTVEIVWESEEIQYFDGAERLWRFKIDHGYWMKNALPFRWQLDKFSPNSLMTGTWDEAEKKQQSEKQRHQWQSHTITKISDESSIIKSFHLTPDRYERPAFDAGQFITLKAVIDGKDVIRTYTVSSSPHDKSYRISVKRETSGYYAIPDGIFSSYLHDTTSVGDTLQIKAATGNFIFNTESSRPAVLIAAGIGITPMMSMARFSITEAIRTRSPKQLTIIHAARNHEERAFFDELKELEKISEGNIRCYWILSETSDELKAGVHYNQRGRLNKDLLQAVLPLDDYDFYLCGPPGFMQGTYDLLRNLSVDDKRIYAEAFGPASLQRKVDRATQPFEQVPIAQEAIVEFTKSKVKQAWSRKDGTLLEFAEAHGLIPEYGCRSGQCGSCKVKLATGKISYNQSLQTDVNDDEVILCCAMPAEISDKELPHIAIEL